MGGGATEPGAGCRTELEGEDKGGWGRGSAVAGDEEAGEAEAAAGGMCFLFQFDGKPVQASMQRKWSVDLMWETAREQLGI